MSRLKVVVRRLPPNLPEPIFWTSVSDWVSPETVSFKSFHGGKPKSRPDKQSIPSRAYIVFKSPDHLTRFSREYDGHAFRDKQGNESFAVVEFSPFQKVPQDRKKVDARVGTILQDEDYKSFVESLSVVEPLPQGPEITRIDPKTTPLLERLKADKAAAKDAAQILSYHGHYRGSERRSGAVSAAHASSSGSKHSKSTAGAAAKGEDGAVYSRKLTTATESTSITPTAVLTKPEGKSGGRAKADPPSGSPSKQAAAAKKKQGRPQPNPSSAPPTPTLASASPRPAPSKADAADATLSGASKPTGQEGARPERKRQGPNRMFAAAIAGVDGAKRREPSAKKAADGDVAPSKGGATPAPSTTSAAPSNVPVEASASTSEKTPRQPKPAGRGGDTPGTPKPKRERPPRSAAKPAPTGNVAAPTILSRQPAPTTTSTVTPTPTSPKPAAADTAPQPADTKDAAGGAPARGGAGGRRGRGRGRGRGGPPSGAPAASGES